ncbi:hypothetical protein HYW61_00995 [candidate division WWE3 bacterium]|nr:hypothetical protein [candidate division WWE3 bacterium]
MMSIFEGVSLPKTVYETESKFNGKISVIQVGKTRKLSVDGVVQSVNWDSQAAKKMYWGVLASLLKERVPDAANIMILGLGGGALQHLVSKLFPRVFMLSVEIDEVIVDIAEKFFDIDKIANHRIIIADACRVVVEPEEYKLKEAFFDALVVDIYCGQKYPELGKSGNFVSRALKLVKPGGIVVFNRIYLEEHQDDVNTFIEFLGAYLNDINTEVVAGKTNSDNILIYGRVA